MTIKARLLYLLLCIILILSACQAEGADMESTISLENAFTTGTISPMTVSSTIEPTISGTDELTAIEHKVPSPTPDYTVMPTTPPLFTSSDCMNMETVQYVTPITIENARENARSEGEYNRMDEIVATLPVTIADQLSPEEIAVAMFCGFLAQYQSSSIQAGIRIDDFLINSVRLYYPDSASLDDSVALFSFAVLPTNEQSNYWLAGNGGRSADGWIWKGLDFFIQRNSDYYIMADPHTGA